MRQNRPRNAGVVSVLIAAVVLLAIYTLLGTVDLVFVENGKEVSRQKGVSVISEIELPDGDISCTIGEETKNIDDVADLKTEIGIMVATNLLTFKWQEKENIITINSK